MTDHEENRPGFYGPPPTDTPYFTVLAALGLLTASVWILLALT